jgi:hypothetical protein
MKLRAILIGGLLGGIAAAVMLATVGRFLDFRVPPWDWASKLPGRYGDVLEWTRVVAVLAPVFVVLGWIGEAVCAVVFEFITLRAGWWRGALVGLCFGISGAAAVGLLPWAGSWYGYAYMPTLAPFGTTTDPSWALVAIVVAGVLIGARAGAGYGRPIHALDRPLVVRWREIYPTPSLPTTDAARDRWTSSRRSSHASIP